MSGIKYGNREVRDYGILPRSKGRRYHVTLCVFTSKWGQYPYYTIKEEWEAKTGVWVDHTYAKSQYKDKDGKKKKVKLYKSISIPVGRTDAFIKFLSSFDTDKDTNDCAIHEDIVEKDSSDPF